MQRQKIIAIVTLYVATAIAYITAWTSGRTRPYVGRRRSEG